MSSFHLRTTRPTAIGCLGWLYLFGILLWFGLRLLFFDRFWWLALLNTLALYLFVPLVFFVPVAIWRRRRRLLLGLALPCLIFLLLYQPLLNPLAKTPAPAQTGSTLKVMSFNRLWSNRDYPKIVQMIRDVQPDIIGMQEVRPREMAAIAAALAPEYPYYTVHPVDRTYTVGVLSHIPIDAITILPDPPMQQGLQVTVHAGAQALRVAVVHLAPNNMPLWPPDQLVAGTIDRYTRRASEVSYLQSFVRARTLPTLVLCDCNMTDTSETYAQLSAVLRDSFQERGWGFGHTMRSKGLPFAVQRIDYIWHTDDIHVVDAFVGPDGGSDHLPMVASFTYP